jgi:hypothetical protein
MLWHEFCFNGFLEHNTSFEILKRKSDMHKIIFITDQSQRDKELVRCLNMLFPECEIEIRSRLQRSQKAKTTPLRLANIESLTHKLMGRMEA